MNYSGENNDDQFQEDQREKELNNKIRDSFLKGAAMDLKLFAKTGKPDHLERYILNSNMADKFCNN